MGDMGDYWKDVRAASREHKDRVLPGRIAEIEALADQGFHVLQMEYAHYRINGKVDLYATRRRFHVLKTGQRGGYQDALFIAKAYAQAQVTRQANQ